MVRSICEFVTMYRHQVLCVFFNLNGFCNYYLLAGVIRCVFTYSKVTCFHSFKILFPFILFYMQDRVSRFIYLFIYLLFLFFSVFYLYLLLFVRSFARLCPPYNSIGTRTPTTVMSCLTSLHCWTLTSPHSTWLKTAETLFRVKVKKKWLTYMYLFLCNPLERSRALILCARLCKGGLLYSKHPLKRNI